MSADKVRKLLASLHDDPENDKAWSSLEERAIEGEFAQPGSEAPAWLAQGRAELLARGEAEAAARLLDLEVLACADPPGKARLLRERARVLEEELLDDRTALAALESVGLLGLPESSPEAQACAEARERLASRTARWKDLLGAYRRHAENDSTDPALIASHLVSAAGILLQYKGKGKEREADTVFEQALAVDPGNLRAVQLWERVLRRRGNRWDDLASHLEKSAEAVTDLDARVHLLYRAGRAHAARRSDVASAERVYRRVLELRPGDNDATRFVVAILQDRERWDDLARFYEEQLRFRTDHSEDVGLLVQAAMTHWRMRNDPAAARPLFERLAQTVPGHTLAETFFREHGGPAASVPSAGERMTDPDVTVTHHGETEVDLEDAPTLMIPSEIATAAITAAQAPAAAPAPEAPPPAPARAMTPPAATPVAAPAAAPVSAPSVSPRAAPP
ncbi:MAG: hypothetical protein HY909_15995, partial [Deltaproteobacteria bacterium]|nr:hypothetical protein [Deltaproteobacteria bacterium]